MKVALFNLEPDIVNTAMMQVSEYHKEQGNFVTLYDPSKNDYDKIYAFSLFNYTDKSKVTPDMICGGTGFDIKSRLPPEIESCDYDWSLYSNCDYSILYFSRGCVRNCPFCIVRQKEGYIHLVEPKNLNPNGKYIKIHDNNFFANPKWREAIEYLKKIGQKVEFDTGVDARTLTEEQCNALMTLKHYRQIKIAWDNPKDELKPKLIEITKIIKPYKLMCFVLIGFDSTPEQDLSRVEVLRELKIDPFVMPFNKKDKYQQKFARWVNHKAIFKSVSWKQYQERVFGKSEKALIQDRIDEVNAGKVISTKELKERVFGKVKL